MAAKNFNSLDTNSNTQSFLILEPKSSHKALDNGMRLTVSEVNTKNLGTTILLSSSEYCCKSSLQKAVVFTSGLTYCVLPSFPQLV